MCNFSSNVGLRGQSTKCGLCVLVCSYRVWRKNSPMKVFSLHQPVSYIFVFSYLTTDYSFKMFNALVSYLGISH